jgi:hypothetical protein
MSRCSHTYTQVLHDSRLQTRQQSLHNTYGSRSSSEAHHIEKEHCSSIIEMKYIKYKKKKKKSETRKRRTQKTLILMAYFYELI